MLAHFQDLKAQMNKLRDAERDKLTKLTLESNAAIKELKRQQEKVRNLRKFLLAKLSGVSTVDNLKYYWDF